MIQFHLWIPINNTDYREMTKTSDMQLLFGELCSLKNINFFCLHFPNLDENFQFSICTRNKTGIWKPACGTEKKVIFLLLKFSSFSLLMFRAIFVTRIRIYVHCTSTYSYMNWRIWTLCIYICTFASIVLLNMQLIMEWK